MCSGAMNKGELKALIINDIGNKAEDMLEAAKAEYSRHRGGSVALLACSRKIAELASYVDRDLEEGLFKEFENPHLVAQLIKRYISRAVGVADSLAGLEAGATHTASGKVQMAESVVRSLKKEHDAAVLLAKQGAQVDEVTSELTMQDRCAPRSLKEQRKPAPKGKPKARTKKGNHAAHT